MPTATHKKEDLISSFQNINEWINDPYIIFDRMRAIDPVYWNPSAKHRGWFITGYVEAKQALKDIRLKSRVPLPRVTNKYQHLKPLLENMLLYQNHADHLRLRKIISQAFSSKNITIYQPFIEDTVNDLVKDIHKQKRETIDLISEFAFPLTSLVIAKLLGIPEEERQIFRKWAVQLVKTIDLSRGRDDLKAGDKLIKHLTEYFRNLILKKQKNPDDDLISKWTKTKADGKKLTEDELIATCILLVIAGHETTVSLIGNSVLTLLKHPEQLKNLQENPSLIDTAVEEFLRYESPTQLTARTASHDLELGKNLIKKGEHVYILLGAANRDSKKFEFPDVLDIERKPNPHLAFGYGSHFCIGASLARLEAKIALGALIQEKPNIKLSNEIQWRRLIGFRALEKLPVNVH